MSTLEYWIWHDIIIRVISLDIDIDIDIELLVDSYRGYWMIFIEYQLNTEWFRSFDYWIERLVIRLKAISLLKNRFRADIFSSDI